MLYNIIAGYEMGDTVLGWIENAAIFIEALAVIIIVVAIMSALARYLFRYAVKRERGDLYHQLKVSLGKALLLGLEILVAADVIHTVALEATLESVIRTFLSWALVVEIEGHWPWRRVQTAGGFDN